MVFKLPSLRENNNKPTQLKNLPLDLPITNKEDLELVKTVGWGSYGKVILCKKGKDILILKELTESDDEGHRLFIKEAKLLNSLDHPNIVTFHSLVDSSTKCSYLMEYVSFDLGPFSRDFSVSSLDGLLTTLDSEGDFSGFRHFQVNVL